MSEEKFTPGEWKAEITRVRFPNGKMMWVEGGDFDVQIANAALIATAPEMYRFIKRLYDCGLLCRCDMEEAEELLKKARGKK